MRLTARGILFCVASAMATCASADEAALPNNRVWHLDNGKEVHGEPIGFAVETLRIHRKRGDIYVNGTTLREGPRSLWERTKQIAKLHRKDLHDIRDLHETLAREPNTAVTLPYAVLECRTDEGVKKIALHELRGDSFAAIKKPFDAWFAEWQEKIDTRRRQEAETQARVRLAETQRLAELERLRLQQETTKTMYEIKEGLRSFYIDLSSLRRCCE